MRWKITIEGLDEFGGRDTAEMAIEKQFNGMSNGEIGLSISDGKTIMAQQCEASRRIRSTMLLTLMALEM